nr:DNA alkylation repair protein [Galbitalea soli]
MLADADPDGPAAPLAFYGCSVGAIRGTIRDLGRRHPALTHDAITALASELWAVPVYERRLAAVVLLQRHVRSLGVFDLTRIEGFVRASGLAALVDPLAVDVVAPLLHGLDESERMRARTVLDRWAVSDDRWLRRAADQVSTAPPRARR